MTVLLVAMLACRSTGGIGLPPADADAQGGDASLATLTVSGVALSPEFAADRLHYALGLDAVHTIAAVPTDPNATVELRLTSVDGAVWETHDSPWTVDVHPADRVEAIVTSADGGTTRAYAVLSVPDDLPGVRTVVSGRPAPGFFHLAGFTLGRHPDEFGFYLQIVDDAGTPLWFRETPGPGFDLKRQPSGALTWIADDDQGPYGVAVDPEDGHTEQARWRGVASRPDTWVSMDIHELAVTDAGTTLYNTLMPRVDDLSAYGGPSELLVLDNVIQEVDGAGELVFEWNTGEHLPYDGLPPAVFGEMRDGWEYPHLNSVDVDPGDGALVVSARNYSQVVKIARSELELGDRAVQPGEVVWRLGGEASDFTILDDARGQGWSGFATQHCARMLAPDRVMLFDNSLSYDLGDVGDARMVTYDLDFDAMTATVVDEFSYPGSGGVGAAGSVQRLPGGHTVIGWGSQTVIGDPPAATELDADGNVVVELYLPDPLWTYRVGKY